MCFTNLIPSQVGDLVSSLGEPRYREAQLRHWVYRELASSFDEMSDLPRAFRLRLKQQVKLQSIEPVHQAQGSDGTIKILFVMSDGKYIESAIMSHQYGKEGINYTVCVSTQVGCPIGCPFCATGQHGFERNLTQGEIIDQVLYFARFVRERGHSVRHSSCEGESYINNLVFMGMGEPLANYDAVLKAIRILISPLDFGLGARNIVISTAGLVPQIIQLAREKLQVGLAVSLHASENTLRSKLVPINNKYPLEQLLPACQEYFEATHRRISFEYVLFDGINDSIQQARTLAHLIRGLNCYVNLIPANFTTAECFRTTPREKVVAFQRELERLHITCTVRESKGLDIDAGCGQLWGRFPPVSSSRH